MKILGGLLLVFLLDSDTNIVSCDTATPLEQKMVISHEELIIFENPESFSFLSEGVRLIKRQPEAKMRFLSIFLQSKTRRARDAL
jgi:hypothetical protein